LSGTRIWNNDFTFYVCSNESIVFVIFKFFRQYPSVCRPSNNFGNHLEVFPFNPFLLLLFIGIHDISQPVALDQFSSDHLLVLFDVYSGTLSLNPQTKVPSYIQECKLTFIYFLPQSGIGSLYTIGGPPNIDLMVNHPTSCILEVKNIVVPNVFPYRYKLKLTEEIGDLIRFRNQFIADVGVKIRTVNSRSS
jgi:hypothetical protein